MRIRSLFVFLCGSALSGALVVGTSLSNAATTITANRAANLRDGSHDFDFLNGRWKVRNRRLLKLLAGSDEWVTFDATDEFHALPGMGGSQENYRTEHWKHFVALGLHLYSPDTGQWHLYWADNRNAPGILQTLARGTFSNGIGIFEGQDTFDGKPIAVRITWKPINKNNVRWEQAFSIDDGKSWETNWTMDFKRQ